MQELEPTFLAASRCSLRRVGKSLRIAGSLACALAGSCAGASAGLPVDAAGERLIVAGMQEAPAIDGDIAPREWREATVTELPENVRIWAGSTSDRVYIGVESKARGPSYVDAFMRLADGTIVNLHASMQLGERTLDSSRWTDADPPTQWGFSEGWRANTVALLSDDDDIPFAQAVRPYDGIEFALNRRRFGGDGVRLRIEVRDFVGQRDDLIFPAASRRDDPTGWALLDYR